MSPWTCEWDEVLHRWNKQPEDDFSYELIYMASEVRDSFEDCIAKKKESRRQQRIRDAQLHELFQEILLEMESWRRERWTEKNIAAAATMSDAETTTEMANFDAEESSPTVEDGRPPEVDNSVDRSNSITNVARVFDERPDCNQVTSAHEDADFASQIQGKPDAFPVFDRTPEKDSSLFLDSTSLVVDDEDDHVGCDSPDFDPDCDSDDDECGNSCGHIGGGFDAAPVFNKIPESEHTPFLCVFNGNHVIEALTEVNETPPTTTPIVYGVIRSKTSEYHNQPKEFEQLSSWQKFHFKSYVEATIRHCEVKKGKDQEERWLNKVQ